MDDLSLFQGFSMHRRMTVRSGGDHRQRPPPLTFPPSFSYSTPFPHWISQNEIIKVKVASGMAVNDECKLKFLELKTKRTHRFIIYKIEEKLKQVIVEKLGEPTMGYEDFTASLPENECRYVIYDFDFVTAKNCQKSKIFFIAWSPATSRVRSKCFMRAPRIGPRESWMAFKWSYKLLILRKWALML